MNKINNNLPLPDQAASGPSTAKLHDRSVSEGQGAQPKATEPASVESKPLLVRKVQSETPEFKKIKDELRTGPLKAMSYKDITTMLAKIGITSSMAKLPSDFSKRLLETTEFEPPVKVFILDHFKDELDAQYSDQTLNETIAQMKQAGEQSDVIDSIKMNWPKNAFEQKFHMILIRYTNTSPEAKNLITSNLEKILESVKYGTLSTKDLQDYSSLAEALEDILSDNTLNAFIADVSKQVFETLQDTQKTGKPIPKETPPPLSQLARAELQKVFSDEEVAKLMAFLQTDKTTAHQKILHFEKVKVNKEAMAELMASPEFQDFLKAIEGQIFTKDLQKDFEDEIAIAQSFDSSKKTIKVAKRNLKKIEKKMIGNLNKAMASLKRELLTPIGPRGTNAEVASKLSALVKIAGDKKIATRDMFMIILKRIGLGIGLCITALFAGAALCAIFIALVKASIIIIPAVLTVSIIVGVTMLIFGITGFSVGAFGNVDVRKKFKNIMGHIATFGTNMNVRFTEQALAPGVDKMVQAM